MARGTPVKDMIGFRSGFLTVVERAVSEYWKGTKRYAKWRCRCDCGEYVEVSGHLLRKGVRKACGRNGHRYTRRDHNREHWAEKTKTGLCKKFRSEYSAWTNMRERCQNPKAVSYKYYGARGITVCERWRSFEAFIQDMGPKPASSWTIDRKDPRGNYEPKNCRWATKTEQSRNRTNSVFVEYEGRKMLLIDVVAELGLTRTTVYNRLRYGWNLAGALSIPVKHYKKKLASP